MTVQAHQSSRDYSLAFTPDQRVTVRRWFGSVRVIRNQSLTLLDSHPLEAVREKLEAYVEETTYLRELPNSSIEHELRLDNVVDGGWYSRKHDTQSVVIGPSDFELTVRATVTVTGLGELDVDFNEGIPEPFPTKIELLQDPSGDATIRIYYAGDFHNV